MHSVKLYPDRTVTSGLTRKYKPPRPVAVKTSSHVEWVKNSIAVHGIEATLAASPGSSLLTNSHRNLKPRASRGSRGMTAYQRRLVRAGAEELTRRHGKYNCSLVTTTLPPQYAGASSDEWSEILRQFVQKWRRFASDNGLDTDVIGVTEIQERRLALKNELALHWHGIGQMRTSGTEWRINHRHIREWWKESVENVMGIREGTRWDAAENVEGIRKDAAGYLGKYMSKGSKVAASLVEQGLQDKLPHSWCTASLRMRQWFRKNTFTFQGHYATRVLQILRREFCDWVAFHTVITVEASDGQQLDVGAVFKLRKIFTYREWAELIHAAL